MSGREKIACGYAALHIENVDEMTCCPQGAWKGVCVLNITSAFDHLGPAVPFRGALALICSRGRKLPPQITADQFDTMCAQA